jgi:IS30 family transposase
VKERYQIEILLKEKKRPSEIARLLGKHKRTIEREIARGTVRMLNHDLTYVDKYCADTAERIYREKAANKGACLKIGHDHELANYIEKKIIQEKYAPDAVIGEIRAKSLKFKTSICTKTLYNYIDKEIFANITNKDLPVKRAPRKNRHKRVRVAHNSLYLIDENAMLPYNGRVSAGPGGKGENHCEFSHNRHRQAAADFSFRENFYIIFD